MYVVEPHSHNIYCFVDGMLNDTKYSISPFVFKFSYSAHTTIGYYTSRTNVSFFFGSGW